MNKKWKKTFLAANDCGVRFRWAVDIIQNFRWEYQNSRGIARVSCTSLVVRSVSMFVWMWLNAHYSDVIMITIASQFTDVSIVYSIVCSSADQRKHQNSRSLAFVRGIHRWPVNSPHKGPVTRKVFPFDDVIMISDSMFATTVCLRPVEVKNMFEHKGKQGHQIDINRAPILV